MESFAEGDIVVLRSGGSPMTVAALGAHGGAIQGRSADGVLCVWTETDKKGVKSHHEQVYSAAVLKKYTPPTRQVRLVRA